VKFRSISLNAESRKVLQGWLAVVSLAGEGTFMEVGLESGSAKALTGCSVQRSLVHIGRAISLECPTTQALCHSFAKNLIDAHSGLEKAEVLPGYSS